MFVLLRSSSGRINFLFIVFRLEYTVIKRPGGIRSQMPGNQSSLCILCLYILIYHLFIISSSLFCFCSLFYFARHIFLWPPFYSPSILISVLFLINILRYYLCLRILFPFRFLLHPAHLSRVFRLAIPCNCSEDKSQRPCCRNAIFCYSERYAQNFIGYSGITVVGNWIQKMAHDKFADVSRCLDLCAPHFPEKATLGICHGNGSKVWSVLIPQITCKLRSIYTLSA